MAWTKVVAMTRIEIHLVYSHQSLLVQSKRNGGLHKMKKELNVIPAMGVGNKVDRIPLQRKFCFFLIPVY